LKRVVDTGSPSTTSIFGRAVFKTALAMVGNKTMADGTAQKPGDESKHVEEQGRQLSTFAFPDPTSLYGNPEKQHLPDDEVNNVGDTTETLPVRIPYNNGFGDFYFGCPSESDKPKITEDMSEELKLELMGITGSNAIPVVELDNFQRYVIFPIFELNDKKHQADATFRSGPFPYDKLPLEIREKIIRILLRPVLFTYAFEHKQVEYTQVKLESLPDPFDNLNYGDEDAYYYSEQSAKKEYKAMLYPGRKHLYDVTLCPYRLDFGNLKGPYKDWLFLRWLRQASYVSTSFRYELGRVLWSRTMIVAGDEWEESVEETEGEKYYRNLGPDEISTLLIERPAAIQGIKLLNITLMIAKGQDISKSFFFDHVNRKISKILDLDGVWFTIMASEDDLKVFIEGVKCGLNGLSATQNWRVSRFFEVDLRRVFDEDDDYRSDDDLDIGYEDAIWEYMQPISLCGDGSDTEENKYLQARYEEFGDTKQTEKTGEAEVTEEIGEIEETGEAELSRHDVESEETAEELDEGEIQKDLGENDDTAPVHADLE